MQKLKEGLTIEVALEEMAKCRKEYTPDVDIFYDSMVPGTVGDGPDSGQWHAQGDVHMQMIHPLAVVGDKLPGGQVVDGQTKGSRHILEGDFQLYKRDSWDPLVGPIAILKERSILTHPEHRNVSFPPGTYAVTYQVDFEAQERARVRD